MKIWLMAAMALILALSVSIPLAAQETPAGDEGLQPAAGDVPGPPRIGPRGKRHFEKMDSDGDGSISKAEWIAYHTTKFDKIDADGDGAVTPDEMRAQRKPRRGDPRRGRGPKPGCKTEGY